MFTSDQGNTNAQDAVVRLIYQAAVDFALWPVLLETLEHYFRDGNAGLWVRGDEGRWIVVGSPRQSQLRQDEIQFLYDPDSYQLCRIEIPLGVCGLEMSPEGVPPLVRPRLTMDHLPGQPLDHPSPLTGILLIARPIGESPESETSFISSLKEHFKAAAAIGLSQSELRLRGRILADVLDRLPVGTLIVNRDRQVVAANRLAHQQVALWPELFLDSQGRLRARRGEHDKVLHQAMGETGERQKALVLVDDGERLGRIVMMPLRNQTDDAVLVFLVDGVRRVPRVGRTLRELYGLSPGEIRIVQGLLDGRNLDDLAESSGVSLHTIRNQMKMIFTKTGTRRQSDLVNLVLTGPAAFNAPSQDLTPAQEGNIP